MKKTLIALAALAGVACAETLTLDNAKGAFTVSEGSITSVVGDVSLNEHTLTLGSGEKWGADVTDGQVRTTITIAMTFDMTKLSNLTSNSKILTLGDYGVGVNPDGSDIKFCGRWNNDTIYGATTAIQPTGELSVVYALRGGSSQGNRIFADSTNTNTYFTANGLRGNVNSTDLIITDLGLSALTKVVVWDKDSFEAGETPASAFAALASIPEPATTTLSLLALAGLAARRRRH